MSAQLKWHCPKCGATARVPSGAKSVRCLCGWRERGDNELPLVATESGGPGSALCTLLGCNAMLPEYRATMDGWCVDGCTERLDIIVDWLVSGAACREQRLDRDTAERLVRIAIQRAATVEISPES